MMTEPTVRAAVVEQFNKDADRPNYQLGMVIANQAHLDMEAFNQSLSQKKSESEKKLLSDAQLFNSIADEASKEAMLTILKIQSQIELRKDFFIQEERLQQIHAERDREIQASNEAVLNPKMKPEEKEDASVENKALEEVARIDAYIKQFEAAWGGSTWEAGAAKHSEIIANSFKEDLKNNLAETINTKDLSSEQKACVETRSAELAKASEHIIEKQKDPAHVKSIVEASHQEANPASTETKSIDQFAGSPMQKALILVQLFPHAREFINNLKADLGLAELNIKPKAVAEFLLENSHFKDYFEKIKAFAKLPELKEHREKLLDLAEKHKVEKTADPHEEVEAESSRNSFRPAPPSF